MSTSTMVHTIRPAVHPDDLRASAGAASGRAQRCGARASARAVLLRALHAACPFAERNACELRDGTEAEHRRERVLDHRACEPVGPIR
jgi:hypothetical protein